MTTPQIQRPHGRHARTRGLRRWVPIISTIPQYDRSIFFQDLGAGLVLTAVLAPVGMGYAEAAGLPAICGLYATIVPLLLYAIFGPSRILVIGPDSALIALVAAAVIPLSLGDVRHAVDLAAVLAIMSGCMCILAGLARFGFVTDLLSKPIRHGYMNGIALTLLVGQLPKLFGFSASGGSIPQVCSALLQVITQRQANWTAITIGLGCLLVIFVCRWRFHRVPGVLLAVVGGGVAVWLLDLQETGRVSVIGVLPQGLPELHVPQVTLAEVKSMFTAAVAIALVSIADMSVLSRVYALRGRYYVNENQELVAMGIGNLGSALFQGFPVSSSASRTPVAEAAGARTQMTCVVGAVSIAGLLLFAPGLMKHVPNASLGAVVVSACVSIMEFHAVRRLYHLRRGEFYLSMICFFGVALLGVIQGIFIAVGLALLAFIWRAWRPYHAVLGRVDGIKGYHDISRHPEARLIPGLVIFRWDAPLFFANAEMFRNSVLKAISHAPTQPVWVIVAAEPVTDVDITAADMIAELRDELRESGVELCFAQMKGPVKDHLKHYGLFESIGSEHFFPTVGKGVEEYLARHRVDYTDWEDTLPVISKHIW